ncbi:MAG TPA: DUF5985 family protein [Bryobacteraceae bacterium]|nr:DUF5985 family protein [Bryobacteraceae bacterium]
MEAIVYALGAATTLLCAVLLTLAYKRVNRRLLLWSGLCFFGLALSNLLVFIDLVLVPDYDLYIWRLATAAIAMGLLLYGLIWGDR